MYTEENEEEQKSNALLFSEDFKLWTKADHDKKILVVDDDPDFRSVMAEYLEFQGYTVLCAKSGNEAMKIITSDPTQLPHLILLDYIMPEESGMSFIKSLETKKEIAAIPTVLVTGYNLSWRQRHLVDGVLEKPFDWSELNKVVDGILQAAPKN